MVATWSDSEDSGKESDSDDEEHQIANLCLMAKTIENDDHDNEVTFKTLVNYPKELLINIVLDSLDKIKALKTKHCFEI